MARASTVPKLRPRNATEDAILAAARELLAEGDYERMTVDSIARRAYVSRTNVYFYFPNKRAVVDRLVQQAFADMFHAGAPYIEGNGDARLELRVAITRVVKVVNANARILLLAAHLSGREDRLPPEWMPYVVRIIHGAEQRIRRDQARGVAPADIPPALAARALTSMVERHVSMELVRGGGDANESIRVLAELWWRAVYGLAARPAQPPR